MEDLILSLDLGTTALKIALFDVEGNLKALSTQEYDLITPKTSFVEADVETYWNSFKEGLFDLKNKLNFAPDTIKALGISAQGETIFFLDEEGKSLRNAIVWMDNRAQDEAQAMTKKFTDEKCYEITGQVSFDPCWPAAKIQWVKNNEPEIFKKTYKFLLIEDYFIYRLTGKFVSEGSLLCSTVYWDINTKDWWQEMLDYLDISSNNLPEIKESGEPVGTIKADVAKKLGLSENTVVSTGALDQAAGAIGVGNIEEGIFSENIGAALAICAPVNEPRFDPNQTMPLHYFAIPDMFMMHTFTTGGMVLRWFRDEFCQGEMSIAEIMNTDSYNLLAQEAEQIPPGSEGLIMLPHLNGSMAPDVNPKAKGVFYGFTLKHKKSHFVRSIMEAIGYLVERNIEALSKMEIDVKEIRSLGGGARSSLWNQIKSDITGNPLITMECKEAACLGAAILAGKAVGIYDDVPSACAKMAQEAERYTPSTENNKIYQRKYNHFKKLFKDLTEMFDETVELE